MNPFRLESFWIRILSNRNPLTLQPWILESLRLRIPSIKHPLWIDTLLNKIPSEKNPFKIESIQSFLKDPFTLEPFSLETFHSWIPSESFLTLNGFIAEFIKVIAFGGIQKEGYILTAIIFGIRPFTNDIKGTCVAASATILQKWHSAL